MPLDGLCLPVNPCLGLCCLEQGVEALEYPVGHAVFRPVGYAGPMPFDGPGQLDDLRDPAVGGMLAAIKETRMRRWLWAVCVVK